MKRLLRTVLGLIVLSIIILTRTSKLVLKTEAAPPPVVQATLSIYSDGTPIFDSTTFTPPSTNNGNDAAANNGVVRTNDDIQYQVEVNLNGEDANNTRFTLTLDNHQVFNQLPAVCLTSGVTPVSAITNLGHTLECNLGIKTQGTTSVVRPTAKVLGSTLNNTTVTADVSATADGANTALPSQVTTLVTAAPRFDLQKTIVQSDYTSYTNSGVPGFKFRIIEWNKY
jgi:hypothetical protein